MSLNDEAVEHWKNKADDWEQACKRTQAERDELREKYEKAVLQLARIKKIIWNMPELEKVEFWK